MTRQYRYRARMVISVAMEQPSSRRPQGNGSQPESDERAALEALVEKVVGAAYEVSNVLGAGFLEKIYERALIEELSLRSLRVKAQAPFPVAYRGKHIGTYAADLVVEDRLLVEVKCAEHLSNQLPEGVGAQARVAHQLPSPEGGVASSSPRALIRSPFSSSTGAPPGACGVHSRLFAFIRGSSKLRRFPRTRSVRRASGFVVCWACSAAWR